MDRARPVVILVSAVLLAAVWFVGRPFLETDAPSGIESALTLTDSEVRDLFASKRSPAVGHREDLMDSSIPSDSTGRRVGEEPEREWVRATSSLDQAHARLAAKHVAVARAEAAFDQVERELEELERYIADLESRGEDPADHAEEGMARFTPAFESYERAAFELERAKREVAIEETNLRSAEMRVEAAERRLESTSIRP